MSKNIFIQESFVDLIQNCRTGESEVYETFTDNTGELFRSLRKEYGRCISRVYRDGPDGSAIPFGWVFKKSRRYNDSRETFTQEVWVTLHQAPPTKTIEYHYLDLAA
jgi:hypothetical protein